MKKQAQSGTDGRQDVGSVTGEEERHAEVEEPSWRRQALQEDRAQGKFLRGKAFKRHILTSKPTRRKRHMRGTNVVDGGRAKLKRMLPYD